MMANMTISDSNAFRANKSLGAEVTFDAGMTLAAIEKAVILETLKRQNYNRTRAARVLGIGIRTLQRKLKQYRADRLDLAMIADA